MKTKNLISIIVPTYKEAGNIPVLSKRIDQAMKKAMLDYEIIIIDDDSDDGTIEAVDKIKKKYKINLKVRKDARGLSSAVIEGFNIASGEIILVMDGDLQHPPESIPGMVMLIIKDDYDFVIGSRFVKGGVVDFNLYRRINAFVPRILARFFTKVRDPMAGFFAFPKKILIPDIELNPLGFKIGLELIVKASPKKIKEVPIEFKDRLYGESKLTIKEQVNYFIHIKRLFEYKYKTMSELIKFSLIGGSGMLIDLFFVFISKELISLPFRLARVVGFVFALTNNFFLNRKFTFKNAKDGNIYKQYLYFFIISVIGISVNWLASVYLNENILFFNRYYLLAAFIGILCGFVVNFIGSKFIVFK